MEVFSAAIESGASLAMVGDTHHALPVGHAGAMATAIRFANVAVELDTVRRFADPEYGALTLQLRKPRDSEHALEVAAGLADRGHLRAVRSSDEARAAMVDGFFRWHERRQRVALVCATNSEADAVNAAIQQ